VFDFLASVLTFFYSLWPSYGVMIILLTLSVRIIFTPLTVRGTKSMLEMRRIQPEMRALQKKYKNDRTKLNLELQSLYREHKINPLGGCLPLLAQAPVFLVLYQVLRGLTRRTSDLGKSMGSLTSQCSADTFGPRIECEVVSPLNSDPGFFDSTFFPRYLDSGSALFKALSDATEMLWIGIDLSLSPSDALSRSLVKALPFLLMILIVGVLGFFQQRQIAGRNPDAEINPMQRTLMRVLPIFLPIISFTLPAGLIVYFITTSFVGIAQQAFITRRVYKPWNQDEKAREAKVEEEPETKELDNASEDKEEPPKGFLGQLLSGPQAEDVSIHGRRRPTSVKPNRPKPVPPKAVAVKESGKQTLASTQKDSQSTSSKNSREPSKSSKKPVRENKASQANSSQKAAGNENRTRGASRRVTPSKKEIEAQNQRKKRRRR